MNHLSKIKNWVWGTFGFILTLLFVATYFVLTNRIEKYVIVKVVVSKTGVDKLLIKSQDMFLINKTKKIRLKSSYKYYDVTIESIEEKENGETELTIKEKVADFTINSTMEARVIYSSIPVWEKILER
ncbi:MAG1140 family protein [Mycoplasma todarodis]|uniref:MAG1140 family protein n=1 Tax=Mycoplasma todarodis TaxID=1937191 RepID=UPI003B35128A